MTISSVQGVDPARTVLPQPAIIEARPLPSLVQKPFYFSPALTVDPKTGTAVLEIRNASTGAVTAQYPSEKDMQAYAQRSLKPETSADTGTNAGESNNGYTDPGFEAARVTTQVSQTDAALTGFPGQADSAEAASTPAVLQSLVV